MVLSAAQRHRTTVQLFIVDDSALVRTRLRELLVEAKLEHVRVVGCVGSIANAMQLIPKLRPDFVILDIKLPDGSGISLLKTIKRLRPTTIVAMLTNYPSDPFRQRALAAGADFFLDKSKQFEEIPAMLRQLTRAGAS